MQSNSISPDSLAGILTGKVCIAGVGNRLKADDAAGPLLIDLLAGKTCATCIDTGVAPENFVEKIARLKPDTLLLVDALDFGAGPGECRLFSPGEIAGGSLSTHALSIGMVCSYLENRSSARIYILGVQPGGLLPGDPPSEAVSSCVRKLGCMITDLLPGAATPD